MRDQEEEERLLISPLRPCFALAAAALAAACEREANPGAPLVASRVADDLDALRLAVRPRGRPLVVNHWATWCGPCVDELPYLAQVARRFEGRVDFLGVSWDSPKSLAEVDRVRAKTGATFPTIVAATDPGTIANALDLQEEFVPQTYVLAASGERVWSFVSEMVEDADKAAFEKAIEAALARPR